MDSEDESLPQVHFACLEEDNGKHSPTQSQLRIINHPSDPGAILAINAGPGSGKTFTVAQRVASLLERGLDPSEILVLSMTNRAVNEFRSTLECLVGLTASKVHISTFHSFSANLVEQYAIDPIHPKKKRRLLDDLSWQNLAAFFLGQTVGLNGKRVSARINANNLAKLLEEIKSGNLTTEDASQKYNVNEEYIVELLQYLDKNGIIRYSHLISDAVELLNVTKEEGCLIPQVTNYKVVVVDEFQDMHRLLLSLVKLVMEYPTKQVKLNQDTQVIESPNDNNSTQSQEEQDTINEIDFGEQSDMMSHKKTEDLLNDKRPTGTVESPEETVDELHAIQKADEVDRDFLAALEQVDDIPVVDHILPSVYGSHTDTTTTKGKHLTVSGDPHQCIYEFLHSDPRLMLELSEYFPDYQLTYRTIEETFRLTPEVLVAAREVALKQNGLLWSHDQNIRSTKMPLHMPVLTTFEYVHDELDFIGREIARLILELGGLLKPGDFLILGRTNREVSTAGKYLHDIYDLRCNMFGQTSSWISSKVHLFLDILSVVNRSAGADFSFLNCLLLIDKRGASRVRASKLFNSFDASGKSSLEDFLSSELATANNSVKSIYKFNETLCDIRRFIEVIQEQRELLQNNTSTTQPLVIMESLLHIVKELGLITYLNTPDKKEDKMETYQRSLYSNLGSFYSTLSSCRDNFHGPGIESTPTTDMFIDFFLRKFNEEVPIVNEDLVNISTVHSAKGLEFPVVFILGSNLEYGSWSNWQSVLNGKQDESKARLFYVACTRAQNLLYCGSRDEGSEVTRKYFTRKLPEFGEGSTLSQQVSIDLKRPMPSMQKVRSATKLFQQWFPPHNIAVKDYSSRLWNHPVTYPHRNFVRTFCTKKEYGLMRNLAGRIRIALRTIVPML